MGRMGKLLRIAAFTLPIAFVAGGAAAAPARMPTSGPTTQPIGHYDFCQRMPRECNVVSAPTSALDLTRDMWARIVEVNAAINGRVKPRTDMEMWGAEEFWSFPDDEGDCEDYVLAKRAELHDQGVPLADLLITVVRQTNGDGHAVLTVRTNLGDFVLDNLEQHVLMWTDTDYTYLKRQSTRNSGAWVSIDDGRAVAVGSVSSR